MTTRVTVPSPWTVRRGRPGGHEVERIELLDADDELRGVVIATFHSRRLRTHELVRDYARHGRYTRVHTRERTWEAVATDERGRAVRRVGNTHGSAQHAARSLVTFLARTADPETT